MRSEERCFNTNISYQCFSRKGMAVQNCESYDENRVLTTEKFLGLKLHPQLVFCSSRFRLISRKILPF